MSAFKQKMARLGARAGLLAGASAALLAISGIGASSAMALEQQCKGTTGLESEGSSLQGTAQGLWTAGFNTSADASACNGTQGSGGKPTFKYNVSSSGTALKEWGANDGIFHKVTDRFIGTDDAPAGPANTAGTQLANIKTALGTKAASSVSTIPLTQTAIAIFVHAPATCTLPSEPTIETAKLQKVFSGVGSMSFAELISGTSGAGCSTNVKRIVRKDPSGTTYVFKHYLSTINSGTLTCVKDFAEEKSNWTQLQDEQTAIGTEGEVRNQRWPECSGSEIERPANTGGGALVDKVVEKAATIGYAALPDWESHKTAAVKLVKIQNSGIGSPTFASPEGTEENANCTETTYTTKPKNAKGEEVEFTSTEANLDWSGVYGTNKAIGGTKYPICALTFGVAATNSTGVFSAGIATTVHDYLNYVNTTTGGGAAINKKWYAPLPTNVHTAAEKAVANIG